MSMKQNEDLSFRNMPLRSRIRGSTAFRYLLGVFFACLAAALQLGVQRLVGGGEDIGGYQFFLGATALSAVWTGRSSAFW